MCGKWQIYLFDELGGTGRGTNGAQTPGYKPFLSCVFVKDALQAYSRCVAFSLLKVATNVPRPACSMARRESATRSRWRTERGRLATAATAPHGLHPLSRLWPSNSLPARRAHSNAPAAPADCQCLLSRAHVSREDSAASPPQQRLPRMAAASNAAASRRIQPPPPAAASTAATALCCPGAAAATSVTATSHECHRRQRRHGHCRRQGGERGAPYVCMRCVSGGCRFLYRKRRYFE